MATFFTEQVIVDCVSKRRAMEEGTRLRLDQLEGEEMVFEAVDALWINSRIPSTRADVSAFKARRKSNLHELVGNPDLFLASPPQTPGEPDIPCEKCGRGHFVMNKSIPDCQATIYGISESVKVKLSSYPCSNNDCSHKLRYDGSRDGLVRFSAQVLMDIELVVLVQQLHLVGTLPISKGHAVIASLYESVASNAVFMSVEMYYRRIFWDMLSRYICDVNLL